MRADASSRFHKDNRWGYFPSFSAGWRVSEEGFMKDIEWIDNLKIRGSWGQLGNINNVGDYDYFSSYIQGDNYNFNDVVGNGIIEAKPANKTLGWETVTITDIGLDFDVLNGLDDEDLIRQGSRRSKSLYLTETGKEYARSLLEKYGIDDWK